MIKRLLHRMGRAYVEKLNRDEVQSQRFIKHNERPIEYRFLFECITKLRPTTVLDVGSGITALPSLVRSCGCVVRAIDNVTDYWPSGMVNRHWLVEDDNILRTRITQQFDLVTCISVIEHIEDHLTALQSIMRLAKPGGHAIITMPYTENEHVQNVYKLPNAAYGADLSYICRNSSRKDLSKWLRYAEVVTQEYWDVWSGTVWAQGKMLQTPRRSSPTERHQLTCLLLRAPSATPAVVNGSGHL